MSKFCPNCRKQLDETMNFCLECGNPLIDETDLKEEIIKCTFKFQCPLDWKNLQTTEDEDIRFCSNCNSNVYLAHSQLQIDNLAREKKCIAFHPAGDKMFYDEQPQYEPPLMGFVLPAEDLEKFDKKPVKKSWWKFWE